MATQIDKRQRYIAMLARIVASREQVLAAETKPATRRVIEHNLTRDRAVLDAARARFAEVK